MFLQRGNPTALVMLFKNGMFRFRQLVAPKRSYFDTSARAGWSVRPEVSKGEPKAKVPFLNRRGFTMVELVLVLFMMALSVGLLMPRIGAGWKRMGEREFLVEMTQTLKRAQIRAMSGGQTVAFRIRGAERRYGLESPPLHGIPENVDIFSDKLERDPETNDRMILFYADGSVSDNDLKLVIDQQRSYRIFIHPISGTIRLTQTKT